MPQVPKRPLLAALVTTLALTGVAAWAAPEARLLAAAQAAEPAVIQCACRWSGARPRPTTATCGSGGWPVAANAS